MFGGGSQKEQRFAKRVQLKLAIHPVADDVVTTWTPRQLQVVRIAAGAAARPKTAAKQLKATVAKPRVLIGVALLLLAFLRGRRVRT